MPHSVIEMLKFQIIVQLIKTFTYTVMIRIYLKQDTKLKYTYTGILHLFLFTSMYFS